MDEKMLTKSKRRHGNIICAVKFGKESFEKVYTEYIKKRLGNKTQ